ncbi:MAG: hypothetical protein GOMPHAMPRED_001411 [Gomphillus americanus]|uniref:Histone H1 n=1 Tax=Gomphillus americanus TaxID=1940652 RepID=A0A8H3F4C2_9LECA|nr:MAG: hypothetical protein GOMPHAMPRED_001411 [Gomphillus americanus]
MAPKKVTGAAAASKAKKPSAGDSHQSTKEMIKEAIITLKERNGSSRQAIKKYIVSNKGVADDKTFTSQLNRALRTGVEKGDFAQPKGPSGPVKLAHKEATKKASPPKDTAAKKETKPKTEAKKKATPAAATKKTAAKPAATKKAAPKKTTAAKPKATANSSSKRKTAPSTSAPAVVDKPTTLTKTKSGRVAKTTSAPAATTKKAPAKKAAPKKAAPKKESAKAEA